MTPECPWSKTSIIKSSYLRGRIGWQGLRASEFIEEGPFLITGTDFVGGKVRWDSCYHVSEERYIEAEYIHIKDNDVLITKDGTIGKIALVSDCPTKAVLNSGIFLLRCQDGTYDHQFMFHLLNSHIFRKFLEDNLAGSTINHLYQNIFEKFRFPIPDIEEQTQIATILSTLDKAIEQTETIIAKQLRIKTGLMQDLLTKGIDEHGVIRSEATHEFKDSSLGRIPVEWEVKRVDELLADVDPSMRSGPFGSALKKDELAEFGVPLLGIDNVHVERFCSDFVRFVPPLKAARLSRYLVRPGDVMITIMGTVGRCCVVPDNIGDALSSKHVWTLTFDKKVYSPTLACIQFNYAPWVLNRFKKDEQGGIMASIRSETLRSTLFPVPPMDEIERIEQCIVSISERIKREQANNSKVRRYKTGLMHDLLTGKVRVKLETVSS
jgi:type I restriction enzyme S subunit